MQLQIISALKEDSGLRKYNIIFSVHFEETKIESFQIKEDILTCNPHSITKGLSEYQWFGDNILMFDHQHKVLPEALVSYKGNLVPVYKLKFDCSVAIQSKRSINEKWNLVLSNHQAHEKEDVGTYDVKIQVDLHKCLEHWEKDKTYSIDDYIIGPEIKFNKQIEDVKKHKIASSRYIYKCKRKHYASDFNEEDWEGVKLIGSKKYFLSTDLGKFIWKKTMNVLYDYLLWMKPRYILQMELYMSSGYNINAWDTFEIKSGSFAGKYKIIYCKKFFDSEKARVIIKAHAMHDQITQPSMHPPAISSYNKEGARLSKNIKKIHIEEVKYKDNTEEEFYYEIQISKNIEKDQNGLYKVKEDYIQNKGILSDFIDIYLNPGSDAEYLVDLEGVIE